MRTGGIVVDVRTMALAWFAISIVGGPLLALGVFAQNRMNFGRSPAVSRFSSLASPEAS
jgi:hypothetical protein